MPKVVFIAGTPGVGKTTIGKHLARTLKAKFLDLPEYVKQEKLYTRYDRARRAYVVDERRLKKRLSKFLELIEGDIVIATHLLVPLNKSGVRVIVLRLNPLALLSRLKRRNYTQNKLFENVEAEFLGVTCHEAVELYGMRRVKQIDTTGLDVGRTVRKCVLIIKNRSKGDDIDWMRSLRGEELDKLLKIFASLR
ncbi:MAG: adenylate kinase family protein [Aigarchaeota archaeon]|nr:adenylate kinase family protein [Candidatus Pelearchaeum maunauluense]